MLVNTQFNQTIKTCETKGLSVVLCGSCCENKYTSQHILQQLSTNNTLLLFMPSISFTFMTTCCSILSHLHNYSN